MIETGLRKWILENADALRELGSTHAQPVFVETAPANAGNHILVSTINTDFQQSIDASDANPNDLIESEVDIDIKADTMGTARNVGKLLLDAVNGFVGQMGDRFAEAVFLEDWRSGQQNPRHGEGRGLSVVEISLRIQHRST